MSLQPGLRRLSDPVPPDTGAFALRARGLAPLRRSSLRGPRLFHGFLKYVPLLWLLGTLTAVAALATARLAFERWPRGILINLVAGGWIVVGGLQAWAAILNGVAVGNLGQGIGNSIGFGVVGWVFGGLALAAGASHRLCGPQSVRATAWLGGYILILAAIAAVARAGGLHALYLVPTPTSLLLPSSPSVTFYASALVFQTEETLGEATTRLVLFFPWATGLGLGGLAITFISTLERDLRWRLIGMAGGMVGVVFSWSRIAIATLVVVGALLALLRLPLVWRLAAIGVLLAGLFALPLNGIDPIAEISRIRDTANSARAGSSLARELIYRKSWEGFLQSPIIGHGWVGESAHRKEVLPIGSHSTFYGLLYTAGLPAAAAFLLTMALLVGTLAGRVLIRRPGALGRNETLVGLGLALCLVSYTPYEALYNLTLPCVFLFTWVGACVGGVMPDAQPVPHPTVATPEPASPRVTAAGWRTLARRAGPVEDRALGGVKRERAEIPT